MSKKVKMTLYAEPGVGKSTFAAGAPNPFFICTDGNFEWLDLPDENHVQVLSWAQAVKVFNDIEKGEYDQFDTIVIDLIEDLFRWCEAEWCKRHKLEHVGDLDFGKGYDMVNKEFLLEIEKLFAVDKHIILLTHAYSKEEKGRGGITKTRFFPSNNIRDKVWLKIEGKSRYFLRAFTKTEGDEDGKLVTVRLLSLTKKEEDVISIARGLDESTCPPDVELNWNAFTSVVGLNNEPATKKTVAKPATKKTVAPPVMEEAVEEAPVVEDDSADVPYVDATPAVEEKPVEVAKPARPTMPRRKPVTVTVEDDTPAEPVKAAEPAKEAAPVKEAAPKASNAQEDKLASIKAKLAALKASK